MPKMTTERFLDLLTAAGKAIEHVPGLVTQMEIWKQNILGPLLQEIADELGIDSAEHKFAKLILKIEQHFDNISDQMRRGIDVDAIVVLTREKTHFSERRIRLNDQARIGMATLHRTRSRNVTGNVTGDIPENKIPPGYSSRNPMYPEAIAISLDPKPKLELNLPQYTRAEATHMKLLETFGPNSRIHIVQLGPWLNENEFATTETQQNELIAEMAELNMIEDSGTGIWKILEGLKS